jgi:malignant T-cell-amplified sequence
MMAPGLLSKGGDLPPNIPKDAIVAIHAEGKEHACGIGKLMASSEEIRQAGKGVAVEVICWIGWVLGHVVDGRDDLWKVDTIGV